MSSKWKPIAEAVSDCTKAYDAGECARAGVLARVALRLAERIQPSVDRDKVIEQLTSLALKIEQASIAERTEHYLQWRT